MKKRILVVDDGVAQTTMVKVNLEKTGKYEVRTENAALKAIDAVKDFQPDLILLDIMMPDKPGDDIAMELQDDPRLSTIPIIFLTAMVSKDETENMGGYIGGRRFLAKPVTNKELEQVITETIG